MKNYGNFYIGFTKEYMFLTKLGDIVEAELSENTLKKSLGEGAVLISRKNLGQSY